MTLPDYPDWQTPIALAEQVSDNLNVPATITANGGQPFFVTAGYQSVTVLVGTGGSAVGQKYVVTYTWAESGIIAEIVSRSFHSPNSYNNNRVFTLLDQLPARGSSLRISVTGTDNAVLPLYVFGSTRTLAGPRLTRQQDNAPGPLMLMNSPSIPASSTGGPYRIPPVDSLMSFTWTGLTSKVNLRLEAVTADNGTVQNFPFWRMDGSTADGAVNPLYIPGLATELFVINTDTIAHTVDVIPWDAS